MRITAVKIDLMYLRLVFALVILSVSFFIFAQYYNFFFLTCKAAINKIDVEIFKDTINNNSLLNKENNNTSLNIKFADTAANICFYLTGINIKNPQMLLTNQLTILSSYAQLHETLQISQNNLDFDEEYNDTILEQEIQKEEKTNKEDQPEIVTKESIIKDKYVTLINETNYNIDLNSIINSKLSLSTDSKKPQILIYHTHTCEAYTPSKKYKYTPSDVDRTDNISFNVAMVGEVLAQTLRKQYGFNVIHDKTIHDGKSYNAAYTNSQKTVEGYLKKYPSLSLIIDLHRDAASINGKKLRVATPIGRNNAANVLMVIGTDGRGLSHPSWRENLKLGVKIIHKMNTLYPGLGRGANLKLGRFNQYLSKNSVLMEIGSNGNTLDEALESTKYIAQVINEVFKEAK